MLNSRFWSKVDVRGPDECWEWQAYAPIRWGAPSYGHYWHNKRNVGAHQYSAMLKYNMSYEDLSKSKLFVLHSCDNPKCVNPDHLSLGTAKDNTRQMHERGRAYLGPKCYLPGVSNPSAVLTEQQAIQIKYHEDRSQVSKKVGVKYGVSGLTIRKIWQNISWKHI